MPFELCLAVCVVHIVDDDAAVGRGTHLEHHGPVSPMKIFASGMLPRQIRKLTLLLLLN